MAKRPPLPPALRDLLESPRTTPTTKVTLRLVPGTCVVVMVPPAGPIGEPPLATKSSLRDH